MSQKEKIKEWKLAARPKNKNTQARIEALKCLAMCYGNGNGVEKDLEEAFKFGSIAAKAMCILFLFVFLFIFTFPSWHPPILSCMPIGISAGRCISPGCYWQLFLCRRRGEAELRNSCALVHQSGSTRFCRGPAQSWPLLP